MFMMSVYNQVKKASLNNEISRNEDNKTFRLENVSLYGGDAIFVGNFLCLGTTVSHCL